jgi:hypothetical protein
MARSLAAPPAAVREIHVRQVSWLAAPGRRRLPGSGRTQWRSAPTRCLQSRGRPRFGFPHPCSLFTFPGEGPYTHVFPSLPAPCQMAQVFGRRSAGNRDQSSMQFGPAAQSPSAAARSFLRWVGIAAETATATTVPTRISTTRSIGRANGRPIDGTRTTITSVMQLSRRLGLTAVRIDSGIRAIQKSGKEGKPSSAAPITPNPASAPTSVPRTRSRPADRASLNAGWVTTMAVTRAQ